MKNNVAFELTGSLAFENKLLNLLDGVLSLSVS